MKKEDCPACLGTGKVPDHICIGGCMRELRRCSLRELAQRMGVSYSHLSLLEHGKRRWTSGLVEKYKENCRA